MLLKTKKTRLFSSAIQRVWFFKIWICDSVDIIFKTFCVLPSVVVLCAKLLCVDAAVLEYALLTRKIRVVAEVFLAFNNKNQVS